jgi:hypothetical protein
MTIAVSIKVFDGLVLAADSATTFFGKTPEGQTVATHVFNHADKIFNLHKGLPIGALTWGAGAIGPASIATRVKDLRRRLSGEDSAALRWRLDPAAYTVDGVAADLRSYMYEELYAPTFAEWPDPPALGFLVGGYSAGAEQPECWLVEMTGAGCPPPALAQPRDHVGWYANGQPEAITRLAVGVDNGLEELIASESGDPTLWDRLVPRIVARANSRSLVSAAMPLPDAIDLAAFFADASIRFHKFMPGPESVGGAVDIAAITRHEGFKWVKRKYYFDSGLNPSWQPADPPTGSTGYAQREDESGGDDDANTDGPNEE